VLLCLGFWPLLLLPDLGFARARFLSGNRLSAGSRSYSKSHCFRHSFLGSPCRRHRTTGARLGRVPTVHEASVFDNLVFGEIEGGFGRPRSLWPSTDGCCRAWRWRRADSHAGAGRTLALPSRATPSARSAEWGLPATAHERLVGARYSTNQRPTLTHVRT